MSQMGMGCEYTFYKNGEYAGKTKNIITDGFWSRMLNSINGTKQVGGYCALFLGTGTTPVTPADTGMEANVLTASRTFQDNQTSELQSERIQNENCFTLNSRYYGAYIWTKTFGGGSFSGQVITEVGARFSASGSSDSNTSTVIDSHALIADARKENYGITLNSGDTLSVVVRLIVEFPYNVPSNVSYLGNNFRALLTATECGVGNSGGLLLWSPLNISESNFSPEFLGLVNNGTYPINYMTYSLQTVSATAVSGVNPNTNIGNMSSDADGGIEAVTVDVPNKRVTINWTFGMTASSNLTTGLARLEIGDNISTPMLSWKFDPPLSGAFAHNVLSLTVTFQFGDLSTLYVDNTMTVGVSSGALAETGPNGAYTTDGIIGCFVESGGQPPFTYSWTRVSGGTLLSADSPTGTNTTLTGTGTTQTTNEVWKCTVTDSSDTPQVVDSPNINVDVTWS